MSGEREPHPSREQLAAFDAGQLTAAERDAVERHLAGCPACGRELDALPEDPFVALVRASSEAPDLPAALAGHSRYRVLEVLGAGGMGTVYKAVHRLMDRVVVLKVLHRRFTDRPDFIERFRQEVQAVARLSHPHIALAHDAEQAGGVHFLVMEFVPGESLDRLVARRGPPAVAEACAYVRQAALGLQHAFEHGLIHCDVKPANLMLTPAGQVKLLDFGLSRLAEQGAGAPTPAGAFAGTPDYTAPEQARDPHAADIRADVYGLGCTLYFLLTGRPLFPGGSTLQKLLSHQDRPARPLADFRDDVPAALAALLERMLSKEPFQRPATPADVARELAPFAGAAEPAGRAAALSRRRLWPLAAGLLILTGAAGGLIAWAGWLRTSRPVVTEHPGGNISPPTANPLALATPEQIVRLRNERRDQALDWLRRHGRQGRAAGLVRDTASQFDRYPGQIDGFQITLGAQWLEARQPTLLTGYPGGFFVFPLSAEQARALELEEGTRRIRSCRNFGEQRRAVPRVLLSGLTFDAGRRLNLTEVVRGSLAYKVRGPAITEAFAVRLGIFLDGGQRRLVLQWLKGQTLEGQGTLRFACPPLASRGVRPRGPVVVFADLCTDLESSMLVESDAAGELVESVLPATR